MRDSKSSRDHNLEKWPELRCCFVNLFLKSGSALNLSVTKGLRRQRVHYSAGAILRDSLILGNPLGSAPHRA